nr:threonine synthase [Succinivibrio sp.]
SRPNNWPRVEALCRMMGWPLSSFDYGSMTDSETEETMRRLYQKTGYIAEPHAAIAYQTLQNSLKPGETGIFLGTAHPAKFKSDVERILSTTLELPQTLQQRSQLPLKAVTLPADYAGLKAYILQELGR